MWIVDKDLLDEGIGTQGFNSRVGVHSHDYNKEKFDAAEQVQFRLKDADDEIYYEGRMTRTRLDGEHAFAPLDWATDDAGCVTLEYLENGVWEVL